MTSRRRRHASFVGRKRELDRLDRLWHDTREGHPSFLVIEGDAGIGKTRLTREFADRVRRGGARVLRGNCIDLQEGGVPYAPFRQALRETANDPGLRTAIEASADELSNLLTGYDELIEGEHSRSQRAALFETLLRLLREIAATRPLLLVIEDVHWADHTTLDVLTFLSRNMTALPVLSILTYRSQPVSGKGQDVSASERQRIQALRDFLFGHVSGAITERLHLAALKEREIAQQIADLTEVPPRPSEVTEIARRSGGNPLFVEEILTSRQSDDGQLSPSLRQLLLRRVHELPDDVREVLDVIAVAGQTVDHDLLRAVADLPPDALRARLREAIDADVLVEEPDGGHYAFRHALVQEALYEDLTADHRQELHRRFADVLVARQRYERAAPEAIARHWDLAGDAQRALRAYIRAAAAARETFGFADAERFLRRAYELWDRVDEPALPSMSWRQLANMAIDAALAVQQPETAIATARDALYRAQEERDIRAIAFQRRQLARVHWFADEEQQALKESLAAFNAVKDVEPSTEQALIFALRASILALNAQHHAAGALAERTLDVAMHAGAPRAYRNALATLGSVLARQGDLTYGLQLLDEAEELARVRNDADEVMRIVVLRGRVMQAYARWDQAWEHYKDGLTAAPKYGMHQHYSWRFYVLAARMSFVLGEWKRADNEILQARDLISGATATLPSLLVATGRFDEASAFFADGRSKWRSDGTGLVQVPELPVEMAAWQRRFSRARDLVNGARALIADSEDGVPEARLLRAALRAEADAVEALPEPHAIAAERVGDLLARLQELHAERPPRPDGFGREIDLLTATGKAEYLRRMGTLDPDAWALVVDKCEALAMPYPAAYARWRQALALRSRGLDKTLAAQLQAQAIETAERLGAQPLRDAIRGVTPRSAPVRGPTDAEPNLTPREREVAGLLAKGHTNREIAETLVIAEGTASVHVSNVLRKLGVRSRAQAVALLLRRQQESTEE